MKRSDDTTGIARLVSRVMAYGVLLMADGEQYNYPTIRLKRSGSVYSAG